MKSCDACRASFTFNLIFNLSAALVAFFLHADAQLYACLAYIMRAPVTHPSLRQHLQSQSEMLAYERRIGERLSRPEAQSRSQSAGDEARGWSEWSGQFSSAQNKCVVAVWVVCVPRVGQDVVYQTGLVIGVRCLSK